MRNIKTKLWVGLSSLFFVAYLVLLADAIANQRIVQKVDYVLTTAYPALQTTVEVQQSLEEIHNLFIESENLSPSQDSSLIWSEILRRNSLFLDSFNSQINKSENAAEIRLIELLKSAYVKYLETIRATKPGVPLERGAYDNLFFETKVLLLSLYDLNIQRLVADNEEMKAMAINTLNLQRNVSIIGLTVLSVLIILLPFILLNPIDRMVERMKEFYEDHFNQLIDIEANHELEKLEKLFELIVEEMSKMKDSNQIEIDK